MSIDMNYTCIVGTASAVSVTQVRRVPQWARAIMDWQVWLARVWKSLRVVPITTMQVTLNVLGANKTLREWCPNIKEIVFGEE